jgi:hypothetical protein
MNRDTLSDKMFSADGIRSAEILYGSSHLKEAK